MTLQQELEGYMGTEAYHRISLVPIVATDGVLAFAEKGSAFWAVDDMCITAHMELKKHPFIAVTIKSTGSKADMIFTDGNYNQLKKKHYAHTDLEAGEYEFYIIDGVILLTSEY